MSAEPLDVDRQRLVQPAPACVGEAQVDDAPVVGPALALDESGRLDWIDQPGRATARQCDGFCELTHREAAAGRSCQSDEDLEPAEGEIGARLELSVEHSDQSSLSFEQQAEGFDALVVEIRCHGSAGSQTASSSLDEVAAEGHASDQGVVHGDEDDHDDRSDGPGVVEVVPNDEIGLVVPVVMLEFGYRMPAVEVAVGATVRFDFVNEGGDRARSDGGGCPRAGGVRLCGWA